MVNVLLPATPLKIVTLLVELATPLAARLIDLVLALEVAPVPMFRICVAVDCPIKMLPVCVAPPMVVAPVVALVPSNVADVVVPTKLIVPLAVILATPSVPLIDGLALNTTLPEPVAVLKSVRPDSQSAAVVSVVPIQVHIAVVPARTVITAFKPDD